MQIDLPFPPSINTYWRNILVKGRNRTVLSADGREYRKQAIREVVLGHPGIKTLLGPLRATVELYPPDKRRRDIDNYSKAPFDALQHAGVYVDDSQIRESHHYWREPCQGGRCTIIVESI